MRVALRCDRHRHAFFETETGVLEIHCRKCSKAENRPVYHPWRLPVLMDGAVLEAMHDEHEGPGDRGDAATGDRHAEAV